MNAGKDVFTLMHEIKLPPELEVGEGYGNLIWSIRGIYEGYAGWFDLQPGDDVRRADRLGASRCRQTRGRPRADRETRGAARRRPAATSKRCI